MVGFGVGDGVWAGGRFGHGERFAGGIWMEFLCSEPANINIPFAISRLVQVASLTWKVSAILIPTFLRSVMLYLT